MENEYSPFASVYYRVINMHFFLSNNIYFTRIYEVISIQYFQRIVSSSITKLNPFSRNRSIDFQKN